MIFFLRRSKTGVELPELSNPGTASDLLSGKQLINENGESITGTMPVISDPDINLSLSSYKVIANVSQSAGYTDGGVWEGSYTLSRLPGRTVTPGRSSQRICTGGAYYVLSDIFVAGDSNLISNNIKSGVTIFGVMGTAITVDTVRGTIGTLTPTATFYYINSSGSYALNTSSGRFLTIMKNSYILINDDGTNGYADVNISISGGIRQILSIGSGGYSSDYYVRLYYVSDDFTISMSYTY